MRVGESSRNEEPSRSNDKGGRMAPFSFSDARDGAPKNRGLWPPHVSLLMRDRLVGE